MNCIVIAAAHCPALSPLEERNPALLLPLVDRPFLQHVVEFLVDQGITEFDFILSHMPEKIEEFLGDGARWGSRFRFHLARDPLHPYRNLPLIATPDRGPEFFLAHADRLPLLDPGPIPDTGGPALYYHRSGDRLAWSGWGRLQPAALDGIGEMDENRLEEHLKEQPGTRLVEVPEMLRVQAFDSLLESNRALLAKKMPGLSPSGTETDESIWISRNVSLHPSAGLIPPVFIGQNCRIGKGVRLGPGAIVGHDCVLDTRCTVADSVIFPGSYVGEALELDHVLVDKNRLVNVKVGVAVSITDDFILSGISGISFGKKLHGWFSRFAAAFLLVLCSPVLLLTALCLAAFRSGPVLRRSGVVRLPAPADPFHWKTFSLWSFEKDAAGTRGLRHLVLTALPQLIHVARGHCRFVGVAPRTREQVQALPRDWQALYLQAKPGVITEALVQYGPNPSADDLYSAEVFYSVRHGLGHDLRLLLRYLGQVLGLSPQAPAEREDPSSSQNR